MTRQSCRGRRSSDPAVVPAKATHYAAGDVIGAQEVLLDVSATEQETFAGVDGEESLAAAVDQAEKAAIERAVERCGGDLQQAARRLRVSSTTLWRKMRRLSISR